MCKLGVSTANVYIEYKARHPALLLNVIRLIVVVSFKHYRNMNQSFLNQSVYQSINATLHQYYSSSIFEIILNDILIGNQRQLKSWLQYQQVT